MSNRTTKAPTRRPRLWLDLDEDTLGGIELAAGADHMRPGPFIVERLKLMFVEEIRIARAQRLRNAALLEGLGHKHHQPLTSRG